MTINKAEYLVNERAKFSNKDQWENNNRKTRRKKVKQKHKVIYAGGLEMDIYVLFVIYIPLYFLSWYFIIAYCIIQFIRDF